MSELRDRLEALAARGTHRGADDVLGAAQRDAESNVAGADNTEHSTNGTPADDLDDSDMAIIDDGLPVVTLEPRSRRRRRYGSFIATVGIAALVGVGALAVTAMLGSGGANSPEGAVRQLASSINNKDPLAAVDVLVPSEVRSMRETVNAVTQRAADLKIVNEASKPLEGVDLSVDHLQLRTEPLADGYAKVIVTSGDLSVSTHRAQLSDLLQKAARNGSDSNTKTDLASLEGGTGLPTFVVVVRENGGWYVSPAYTTLEYLREGGDYPAADFGSGKAAALGAATPDAAVQDALHAWQSANWEKLISLAPPDELPLYDYRAMIDASAADTEVSFTIDHLSTTSTLSGDTGIVKLDASGSTGNGNQKWQVGGTCPSLLDDAYTSSDSAPDLCLSGDVAGTVPFGLMLVGGSTNADTTGPVSISVVRENGRWFVSPVTTVLGIVDNAIQHIDQRSIYTLLGLAYELPPDAAITLDQPFVVPARPSGSYASRVYSFEGKAGQELVGEVSATPRTHGDRSEPAYVYGMIYTEDGQQFGSVDFQSLPTNGDKGSSYASSIRLPKTGSYRLVLEPYAGSGVERTVTLWDVADAPPALNAGAQPNDLTDGSEGCSSSGFSLGGSSECKYAAAIPPASVSPTTYVAGNSSSGSGFSQSSSGGDSQSVTATSTPTPATIRTPTSATATPDSVPTSTSTP